MMRHNRSRHGSVNNSPIQIDMDGGYKLGWRPHLLTVSLHSVIWICSTFDTEVDRVEQLEVNMIAFIIVAALAATWGLLCVYERL